MEELLPKAFGNKLHATFLPSPPSYSYWKSSSSDNTKVRIRMLCTTSVVNEIQLCQLVKNIALSHTNH